MRICAGGSWQPRCVHSPGCLEATASHPQLPAAWCRGGPSLSATGTPVSTQCGSLSLCSGWRYLWRPIVPGAKRTIQRLHCVGEMRESLPLSAQHFLVCLLGWRLSGYKTDVFFFFFFKDQRLKSVPLLFPNKSNLSLAG